MCTYVYGYVFLYILHQPKAKGESSQALASGGNYAALVLYFYTDSTQAVSLLCFFLYNKRESRLCSQKIPCGVCVGR